MILESSNNTGYKSQRVKQEVQRQHMIEHFKDEEYEEQDLAQKVRHAIVTLSHETDKRAFYYY